MFKMTFHALNDRVTSSVSSSFSNRTVFLRKLLSCGRKTEKVNILNISQNLLFC
jgi:hypothetical protein